MGISHSGAAVVDLHRAMTVSSVSLLLEHGERNPYKYHIIHSYITRKVQAHQAPRETSRSWMLALGTSDSSIHLKLKRLKNAIERQEGKFAMSLDAQRSSIGGKFFSAEPCCRE